MDEDQLSRTKLAMNYLCLLSRVYSVAGDFSSFRWFSYKLFN